MPDAQKLSNPPKFGTQGTPSPSPRTIGDWVSFWRWLTALWAVARESINFPEARAIIPPGPRGVSLDEAIGASQGFQRFPSLGLTETDASAIQALSVPRGTLRRESPPSLPQIPAIPRQNELDALTATAMLQGAYGARQIIFPASSLTLEGTHAARLALTVANYPNGTLYYETDRTVFYIVVAASWLFATGTMIAVIASIPVGLGAPDAGFLFVDSDTGQNYYWNGANFVIHPATMYGAFRNSGSIATTIGNTDFTVLGQISVARAFTLPSASSVSGRVFVCNNSAGSLANITITAVGGELINNAATLILLPGESAIIQSDSANWSVLGSNKLSVASINTLTGAVTLAAGTNITLTPAGNTITIAASGGGGGVTSLANGGSISLSGATGAVTIAVSDPAWTAWTPTVTAAVAVTTAVLDAAYIVTGKTVRFRIYWNGTLGVGGSTTITFTLPVTPKAVATPGFQVCALVYFNNGVATFAVAGVLNSAVVSVRGVTIPAVTTQEIGCEGVFELN